MPETRSGRALRIYRGYVWSQRTSVSPTILHVGMGRPRRPTHPHRLQREPWTLDYARCVGMWCRAGSPRNPWFPRPPHTAHLYPPHSPYWESARGTFHTPKLGSGYFIFRAPPELGLERLVDPRVGVATFFDPDELLWRHIHAAALIAHERGQAGLLTAQARLLEALDLLLRAGTPTAKPSHPRSPSPYRIGAAPAPPAAPSLVERVHHFLHQRLAAPVTLRDLARHLHVSVSTISHEYHRYTGSSPIAALLHLRVNAAKALLLRGERLQEIAEQTGFTDAFHLSKTFKRIEGVPPREYRRRVHG